MKIALYISGTTPTQGEIDLLKAQEIEIGTSFSDPRDPNLLKKIQATPHDYVVFYGKRDKDIFPSLQSPIIILGQKIVSGDNGAAHMTFVVVEKIPAKSTPI